MARIAYADPAMRQTKNGKTVYDVVLEDTTAPIILTAWGGAAKNLFDLMAPCLAQGLLGTEFEKRPALAIRNVSASTYRGTAHPSTTNLNANEPADFHWIATDDLNKYNFLIPGRHPREQKFFATDAMLLQTVPLPCLIHLRGFVGVVQPRSDNAAADMTNFEFITHPGVKLDAVARGRHASGSFLVTGTEVCLYFAKAAKGKPGYKGALWLHDNDHVVIERALAPIPTVTSIIELPSSAVDGSAGLP